MNCVTAGGTARHDGTLRVAHLTPAYFSPDSTVGGGERYVYYVAQALRRVGGFRQSVFAVGGRELLFQHDGIPVHVLRNESGRPGAMDAFSGAVWQELSGFDLVHVHQSLTLFGAYSTAIVRSLGLPAIGTDHGGGENALMLQGSGMELLDAIVSLSDYARKLIDSFFHGPHEVLIGPIDTDRFCPDPTVARDRRAVLCVSRIMPHKGIDRVIAALPRGLRLVVVGHVYHPEYYDLLRRMAAGKDVTFVHDADDAALLGHFRTAGLFVQASTARDIYGNVVPKPELMGLTTLEAMACGLPVLVADTASLPELVPDRRFGRVFANNAELAGILGEFSRGDWPVPDAASLARRHAVESHGMDVIGARLAALYRRVAARAA